MNTQVNLDLTRSERPVITIYDYLWGEEPNCKLVISTTHEATVWIELNDTHIKEIVEKLTVKWPEILAKYKAEKLAEKEKKAAEETEKAMQVAAAEASFISDGSAPF